MSKLKTSLQECLITSNPKKFEKEDGTFSRLLFRVAFSKSKKDKEKEGYINKNLYFQCIVFNEKLADYILNSYKEDKLNFITSIDCQLNDFDFLEVNLENGKTGKSYTDYRYYNIQYAVNDAVITYKDKKDTKEKPLKKEVADTPEVEGDDEIPF